MPKIEKVASYRRKYKLEFPLKWAKINQSFPFFEPLCVFFIALAILEPQIYYIVEQFGAENISLLSRRLVFESRYFFIRC